MSAWQVVLLVNLSLAVGLGFGYARWGRQVERLDQELEAVRAQVERLEREQEARATGARADEQQWEARGVVRAIFPGADLLVITHEEIPGLLPARTTGFRAASRKIHDVVQVGDAIRFTLRGKSRDVVIVAIEIWQSPRALAAPRAGRLGRPSRATGHSHSDRESPRSEPRPTRSSRA